MDADEPAKKDDQQFDVVLVRGKTVDGEGASVLRARPGRLEAGEVRPLREGRPLNHGGEVVRLAPRAGVPHLFDVDVQYQIPGDTAAAAASGPPQVATAAYRESWDRTFGRQGHGKLAN
jgi:hypothetical protein